MLKLGSIGIRRRRVLGMALAATFATTLATTLAAGQARAADQVTIAYIGGTADVGFYIADAKGYLRQEGIEAKFVVFDSSARMVAPLATGDVDVGSGAIGAATYNAFERGITLRAVADKARNKGIYSYQGLVVRKDLWDSGAVRTLRDLKGRKFVTTANGGNESAVIEEAMRSVGMTSADLDLSLLSMPQQVAAYASGALDASFLPEPFLTSALKQGTVVNMMPVSRIRDDDVTGVIVYGEAFIKNRPEVARKMMRAYIRGLRDYADALKDARLAGPGAEEVVDIIARYSSVKDKTVLRSIIPHYVDPDGALGTDSLRKDWAFFKQAGLIRGDVSADQIVDGSFIAAALKDLGPYKPKAQ